MLDKEDMREFVLNVIATSPENYLHIVVEKKDPKWCRTYLSFWVGGHAWEINKVCPKAVEAIMDWTANASDEDLLYVITGKQDLFQRFQKNSAN